MASPGAKHALLPTDAANGGSARLPNGVGQTPVVVRRPVPARCRPCGPLVVQTVAPGPLRPP
eukprot:9515794-Lingulodinium_polyedra.AAC.1